MLLLQAFLFLLISEVLTQDLPANTGLSIPSWVEDNANSSACLPGWTKLAQADETDFKYCVQISPIQRMTFLQAEESCSRTHGAHLLSIQNKQELIFLDQIIDEYLRRSDSPYTSPYSWPPVSSRQYWTGLGQLCPSFDTSKRPDLRWTDKSDYAETQEFWKDQNNTIRSPSAFMNNWEKNYCVTYTIEQKTQIRSFGAAQSKPDKPKETYFKFSPCEERLPFVCKVRALRQVLGTQSDIVIQQEEIPDDDVVEIASAERPCGRDPFWCPLKQTESSVEKTTCYRLMTQRDYWDSADAKCRADFNGNLASIHSSAEMHFISNMSAIQSFVVGDTKLWVGLHRRNADRTYQWTDRTPFNFISSFTVDDDDETGNDDGNCVVLNVVGRTSRLTSQLRLNERTYGYRWTIPLTEQKDKEVNSLMHLRCDNKLPAVCQKPGFGNEPAPLRPTQQIDLTKKCPQDWQQYLGKCYRLYGADTEESRKTFTEAKSTCPQGSNLVSITSPYEQAFAMSLLRGKKVGAWLGLELHNGRLRWIDDVPLSFTRFSPTYGMIHVHGEKSLFPSSRNIGFSQDACAYMEGSEDASAGYWNLIIKSLESMLSLTRVPSQLQETCGSKKLAFVCEQYPTESREPASGSQKATFETVCDEYDSSTENATSFCFIRNTKTDGEDTVSNTPTQGTWTQANSICQSFGSGIKNNFNKQFARSTLSSATNLFEWSFLTAKAKHYGFQEFWLGLSYNDASGTFTWSDGWPVKIGPWGPGEPNLKRGKCGAVRIEDDGPIWVMKDCDSVLSFVCKLSNANPPPSSEFPTAICPVEKMDWIPGATRCYRLMTNQTQITNGYRANHDCLRVHKHATLASFPTEADFKAFSSYIHTNTATLPYAFIGLIQQQGGSFAWTDRSEVTYLNWAPGQPEYGRGTEAQECVQIDLRSDYKWRDVSCSDGGHYVCSVPSLTAADLTTTESPGDLPLVPLSTSTAGQIAIETTRVDAITMQSQGSDSSGVGPSSAGSSSDGVEGVKKIESDGSAFVTVGVVLTIVFILALAGGIIYFVRQRTGLGGLWSSREPRIMQFDSLQNDDEFS